MTGLYDEQGVLRFTGRDVEDCLAYAELFAIPPDRYSLEPLEPLRAVAVQPLPPADPVERPVRSLVLLG